MSDQGDDEGRWREQANCLGEEIGVFYPAPRQSILPAQRICAGCKVWRECAVESTVGKPLRDASNEGAWCGLGGSARRSLIRALRDVDHRPEVECDDPECQWCVQLRAHRVRLDVVGGLRDRSEIERIISFGPGATHGNRVTHARGCRCAPCRFSASTAAKKLKLAGFDPIAWWEWQFSPYGEETTTAEWSAIDEARVDTVLARAKAAVDTFLAERVQETG
jgi:hypothetical protein